MKIFLNYFILLSLLLGGGQSYAQSGAENYPVTVTPIFGAPFSLKISEYFSSSNRLYIDLLLKDLTKSEIQCYLKWTLEGPGVHISTRDGYIPNSFITLPKGRNTRLTGLDLAQNYYRADVLESEGMDILEVMNGYLPEGFYTFKVQAMEASTGREVSNMGEAFFFGTSPYPPIINLPFNESDVSVVNPQNVLIQWTPRHLAVPGSQVVYELKVYEVPDDGIEPNDVVNALFPLISTITPTTFYRIGISDQPLTMGKRYAVQVTAKDLGDKLNNFVNQGRSEVIWFRYGKGCTTPENLSVVKSGKGRVLVSWDAIEGAKGYQIAYRSSDTAVWTAENSKNTTLQVDLPSGGTSLGLTTYEFKVKTICDDLANANSSKVVSPSGMPPSGVPPSDFSAIESIQSEGIPLKDSTANNVAKIFDPFATPTFATQGIDDGKGDPNTWDNLLKALKPPACVLLSPQYVCDSGDPAYTAPTGQELTTLKVGDVLGIYDFSVIVTQSPDASGVGLGLMKVPFMGNAVAAVAFKHLKIKKGEAGTNGGCVYDVPEDINDGYFQVKSSVGSTVGTTVGAEVSLPELYKKLVDSTTFSGTFEGALAAYENQAKKIKETAVSDPKGQQTLETYAKAISKAADTWEEVLKKQYPSQPKDPKVAAILKSLDSLKTIIGTTGITEITKKYKDLLDEFNHPKPCNTTTTSAVASDLITIEKLTACAKQANLTAYDPIHKSLCADELSYYGLAAATSPYWVLKTGTETYYITQTGNAQFSLASQTQWLAKDRNQTNACQAGLWQPVTFKEGLVIPDSTAIATLYTLKNSKVSNLLETTASISWDKDDAFTRYQVSYKDDMGGELIVDVTDPKVDLSRLKANTHHTFSIRAYKNNTLLATATEGSFTTHKAGYLATPQNLKTTRIDDHSITITWDKNIDHKSYELVYTDATGLKHSVYPSVNTTTITGLDPTQQYPFTLVALNASLRSNPANGSLAKKVKVVAAGGPDDLPPLIPENPCPPCDATITVKPALANATPTNLVWRSISPDSPTPSTITEADYPSGLSIITTNGSYWKNLEDEAIEDLTVINKYAILSVEACKNGNVTWKNTTSGKTINGTGYRLMVRPTQTSTYETTCVNGSITCKTKTPITITVNTYTEDCSGTNFVVNTPVINTTTLGKTVTLSASGCTGGVVTWYSQLSDPLGNTGPYNPTPTNPNNKKIGSGLSIDIPYTEPTPYNAECFLTSGSSGKLCKKVINAGAECYGFKTKFVYGTTISYPYLGVDGCMNTNGSEGSVTWTWDNGTKTKAGRLLNPSKVNDNLYTAKCDLNGCTNSISFVSCDKFVIERKKIDCTQMQYSINTGCQNTIFTWLGQEYNGSKTITISRDDFQEAMQANNKDDYYMLYARCADKDIKCTSKLSMLNDFFTVRESQDSQPGTTENEYVLQAFGCSNVSWTFSEAPRLVGKTGAYIRISQTATKTISYTATCIDNGENKNCVINGVAKCRALTAYASRTTIPINQGINVKLFALGCTDGAVIWKDIDKNITVSDIVIPSVTTKYQGTCTFPGQAAACISTIVKVIVSDDPKVVDQKSTCTLDLYVFPEDRSNPNYVMKGEKVVLHANGCDQSTIWEDVTDVSKSPIVVTSPFAIQKPTLFKVTCNTPTKYCYEYKSFDNVVNCDKFEVFKSGEDKILRSISLGASGCGTNYVSWTVINLDDPTQKQSIGTTNNQDFKVFAYTNSSYVAICTEPGSDKNYCIKSGNLYSVPEADNGDCSYDFVGSYIQENFFKQEYTLTSNCNATSRWYLGTNPIESKNGTPLRTLNLIIRQETSFIVFCDRPGKNGYCSDIVAINPKIKLSTLPAPESVNGVNTTNSTAKVLACGEVSTADAMKGYITYLLTNIYTALDGKNLNPIEAKAALLALLNSLCGDANLKNLGIDICKCMNAGKITDAMVNQFQSGTNFADIANAFSSCLTGNMPISTYNDAGRNTYPVVYNGIIPPQPTSNYDGCNPNPPLVFKSPDGKFFSLLSGVKFGLRNWKVELGSRVYNQDGILFDFYSVAENKTVSTDFSSNTPIYRTVNKADNGANTWGDAPTLTYVTVPTGISNAIDFSYVVYEKLTTGKKCRVIKIYKYKVYKDNTGKDIYIKTTNPVCTYTETDCEEGYRFAGDIRKAAGKFYTPSLASNTIVGEIDQLVEELLDDAMYKKYLQDVVVNYIKTNPLTLDNLKAIKTSLEEIKQLETALNGSTEQGLFAKIMVAFEMCSQGTPENANCSSNGGIVPRCIWDNDIPYNPIGYHVALISGFIDEAARTVEGLALIAKIGVGYANYFHCWLTPIRLVLDKSCDANRKDAIKIIKSFKEFINSPDPATTMKTTLGNIGEATVNGLGNIGGQFWSWGKQVTCFDAVFGNETNFYCCGYKQGGLVFNVLLALVGVEELKLAASAVVAGGEWATVWGSMATRGSSALQGLKALGTSALTITRKTVTIGSAAFILAFDASKPLLTQEVVKNASTQAIEYVLRTETPVLTQTLTAVEKAGVDATLETAATQSVESANILDNLGNQITTDVADAYIFENKVKDIIVVSQKQVSTGNLIPILAIIAGIPKKITPDNLPCTYCGKTVNYTSPPSQEYLMCKTLKDLIAKDGVNGAVAVQKLCTAFPTVAQLKPIADKINGMQAFEIQAFFGDITATTCSGVAYLCGNVSNLTVELIEAWKTIATNANNVNTSYLNDFQLLKKVREIKADATKQSYFVSNTTSNFDAFLVNALKETPCNTCPKPADGTWASRFPNLDKMLSNMLEVVPKHTNTNDFRSSFYNGEVLAGDPISIAKRDGGQHMLNYMADRPFTDNAIWIDRKFSYISAQATNSGKEFDLYMGKDKTTPIWFVECKSYQESTNIDVEQFLAYISLIDDFSRLRYVFNDRKLDITAAKNKMKVVLQGSRANDIFDEIWKNIDLRTSLFGNVDPLDNGDKNDSKTLFSQLVQNLDNKVFVFVDVHY